MRQFCITSIVPRIFLIRQMLVFIEMLTRLWTVTRATIRYSISRLLLTRISNMMQIQNPHARMFAGGRSGSDVQALHEPRLRFGARAALSRTSCCALLARSGRARRCSP